MSLQWSSLSDFHMFFPVVGCGEIDGLMMEVFFSEFFHCKQLSIQQDCFFKKVYRENVFLRGGFNFFLFSTLFGEDEPILTSIFFRWVVKNHQLVLEYQTFLETFSGKDPTELGAPFPSTCFINWRFFFLHMINGCFWFP